jgi:hypothetical protein
MFGGIPLALPDLFLREAKITWGDKATIYGQVRFLQDAGLEDTAAYVHHASPIIVFVEKIEAQPRHKRARDTITITPVALFETASPDPQVEYRQRREGYGYTFVHCEANLQERINNAADWLENYAKKFDGRIITNFAIGAGGRHVRLCIQKDASGRVAQSRNASTRRKGEPVIGERRCAFEMYTGGIGRRSQQQDQRRSRNHSFVRKD